MASGIGSAGEDNGNIGAWKRHEKSLASMAKEHPIKLLCTLSGDNVHVDVYFCDGVMRIVDFLINEVNRKELAGSHNTFAIYFKELDYGDTAELERTIKNKRVDIMVMKDDVKIQVKALADMRVQKLHGHVAAVNARGIEDVLWIFYFYQFKEHESPHRTCKYLLARLVIELLDADVAAINRTVSRLVEESKLEVARALDVDADIIIPMPNLVSEVELKRQLAEKDEALAEKDKIIAEKDEVITGLKRRLGTD